MKLKALGTGNCFSHHPLVTSSFLLQSDSTLAVIGCGPNIPAKLKNTNVTVSDIDMWLIQNSGLDQIGGLLEIALSSEPEKKPYLAAPKALIAKVKRIFHDLSGQEMSDFFIVCPTKKVVMDGDHFSETLAFVENYTNSESYGLVFEESEIFITGPCAVNEDFVHNQGASAKAILHSLQMTSLDQLQELPVYLQSKIWIYDYPNHYKELEEPLPMLLLPQGSGIYDSSRKDKYLEKERFIRENTKRMAGNAKTGMG